MSKAFIKQRITNFAGMDFEPDNDKEVIEVLRRKFNIHLPQRPTLNAALASAISDHEIIDLITQYRTTAND